MFRLDSSRETQLSSAWMLAKTEVETPPTPNSLGPHSRPQLVRAPSSTDKSFHNEYPREAKSPKRSHPHCQSKSNQSKHRRVNDQLHLVPDYPVQRRPRRLRRRLACISTHNRKENSHAPREDRHGQQPHPGG
uniref:Uncharacterized protein n=1 Tax=Photinus pyralis TaxID=7054 RepID=A0A1Y1LSB9_PHOPY